MKRDVLSPVILVHGECDNLLDKEVVKWRFPKLLHQYKVWSVEDACAWNV